MNSGSCAMLLGFKSLLGVWIILSVLQETDAIRCPHCNEDFISLGRHTWRCKGRISSIAPAQTVNENRHTNSADQPGNTTNTTTTNFPTPINECSIIKCVCGRPCKGRRGLAAHKRSCAAHRTLSSVYQEASDGQNENENNETENEASATYNNHEFSESDDTTEQLIHKPGLILPKTPSDWRLANAYFHSVFNTSRITEDLDTFVQDAQEKIYNYFKDTHGTVKNDDSSRFHQKYQNLYS